MKNKRFVLGDACKSNPRQVIFVRNDSNLKNKMCVGGERREEYGLIDIEAGVGF